MSRREKEVLGRVLDLYPLIPSDYHRVSKRADTPQTKDAQALLEEALASQKADFRRLVTSLWNSRLTPESIASNFILKLNTAETESFLQVINEIRVGSWIKLGSPGLTPGKSPNISVDTLQYLRAMDVCASLQMQIIEALNGKPEA
jgi:hypothetical protein